MQSVSLTLSLSLSFSPTTTLKLTNISAISATSIDLIGVGMDK